jgi:hypothetical protein
VLQRERIKKWGLQFPAHEYNETRDETVGPRGLRGRYVLYHSLHHTTHRETRFMAASELRYPL